MKLHFILSGCVLWTASLIWAAGPNDKPLPEIVQGQKVYRKACAGCHGIRGDGQGVAARYMDPQPRDFTTGMYKFRSTPMGSYPTLEDLERSVAKGLPGTRMPGFEGLLTEEEIKNVALYIRSLSPDFAEADPPDPIEIPEPPETSEEYVTEGKHLYMMMGCCSCHGAKGSGDGPAGAALVDQQGNPLKPQNFKKGLLRGGPDPKSVYRSIMTGVNGTPMPGFSEAFLFAGGEMDVAMYEEHFTKEWAASLKQYFEAQPTAEELESMSEEDKEKLAERRKWALVHFIRSMRDPIPPWQKIFVLDTENTH